MAAATRVRIAAWIVAAALAVSHLMLGWWVTRHDDLIPPNVVDGLLIIVVAGMLVTIFPLLAAVILGRQPRHAVALLMLGVSASVLLDVPARWYALDGLYVRSGVLPAPEWAAWFAEWNWVPQVLTLMVFLPLLFPDGRLPSPRWRPFAIAAAVWIALTTIGAALTIEEAVDFPDTAMPLVVEEAAPLGALLVLLPVFLAAVVFSLVVRWRRSTGDEREQLRWLLYSLGLAITGWTAATLIGGLGIMGWGVFLAVLTLGPVLLIPVAITIAITKYRLYEIDTLINRTLVYGGLTVSVLGAYALVVLAITAVTPTTPEWSVSLLVVATVAIAAYPLREFMQRSVNQRMYGDRDDPARAMSRLSRRVADSVTPHELLATVTETIGSALRLPYVAVELAGGSPRAKASYGRPAGDSHRIDLVHQGHPVGTLLVGRRAPDEQFTAADIRLLDDVSRQVAAAAHAVQLANDLQRSRERLVLAREEERRRLRRDLHDGVGAALAGLALQAGRARLEVSETEGADRDRFTALEEGIRATVVEVRRIVDDLRPAALDELGLANALRERADALFEGRTAVSCDMTGVQLPAAVEVAAYRIGTEALTNAARHSGAACVDVRVRLEDGDRQLVIEVTDDGSGVADAVELGVGLRSMRERASELGGSCEVMRVETAGTCVRATLPVGQSDATEDEQ